MIKYISVVLMTLLLTACFEKAEPKTELYDDRASLSIMFKEDLNSILSEDDYLVYVQALKFAFDEIKPGSSLDWTGPDDIYGGRIVVVNSVMEDGTLCKEFTQVIRHDDVEYKSITMACSIGSTWNIVEVR